MLVMWTCWRQNERASIVCFSVILFCLWDVEFWWTANLYIEVYEVYLPPSWHVFLSITASEEEGSTNNMCEYRTWLIVFDVHVNESPLFSLMLTTIALTVKYQCFVNIKIWGSHSIVDEDGSVLVYDDTCRPIVAAFSEALLPLSLGKISSRRVQVTDISENPVTVYHSSRRNTPAIVNVRKGNKLVLTSYYRRTCNAYGGRDSVSVKADSHITCRSHAAPMPFPCHTMPLRV